MKSSFESDHDRIAFIPKPLLNREANTFRSDHDVSSPTLTLEQQVQAAYDQGYQAGRSELPWREEEELTRTVETFKVMLDALDQTAASWVRRERDTVVALATTLAEHLVGEAVADDLNRLAPAIEEALDLVGGMEPAEVQLAPGDYERIQSSEDPVLVSLIEAHPGRIVPSDRVPEGTATVASQDRQVVVNLEASLERMADELRLLSALGPLAVPPEDEVPE